MRSAGRRYRAPPAAGCDSLSGRVQPSTETPVRSTSIGCDAAGRTSSTARTVAGKPRREASFAL